MKKPSKRAEGTVQVSRKYLNLLPFLLTSMLLVFTVSEALSQPDHYYTIDGTIMIQGALNDLPVQAISKKVTVLIDYNTGKFQLYFDASTLRTGLPVIDTLLVKEKGNFIEYEGNFGLDHVQTESHPPLDFLVEGYINCSYHNDFIQGKGRLQHLYDGIYACYLNMSFDLTLDQLPFNIDIEGLDENIRIEIVQMLLSQNSAGNHSY